MSFKRPIAAVKASHFNPTKQPNSKPSSSSSTAGTSLPRTHRSNPVPASSQTPMDHSNRKIHRFTATNPAAASNKASSSAFQSGQRSSSSENLPSLDGALAQSSQASTSRKGAVRPVRTGKKRKQIPPTDSESSEGEPRSPLCATSKVAHSTDGQKRPKTAQSRQISSNSASAHQDGPKKAPSRSRLSPPYLSGPREPASRRASSSSGSDIEVIPSQRSSQTPNKTSAATAVRPPSQRPSLPVSSLPSSTATVQPPTSPSPPIQPPSPPPEVPTDQLKSVLAKTFKYLIIQGPEIFSDRQAFSKMTESARDLMNRTSDDMELAIYRTEFEEKENQLNQSDRELENQITTLVEPVLDSLTELVRKQSEAQLKFKSNSEISKLHRIIHSQSKTISTIDARWNAFEQRVASLDSKLTSLELRLETAEGMESRLSKLEDSINKSDERLASLSDQASVKSLKEQDTRLQRMLANKLDSARAQIRQDQEAQFALVQSKLVELDTSQTNQLDTRLEKLTTQQARWASDEVQSIKEQLQLQKQSILGQMDRLGAKLAEVEGDHQSQLDQLKSHVAHVTLTKQPFTQVSRPSAGTDDATVAGAITKERQVTLAERANSSDERFTHLVTSEDRHRQNQQTTRTSPGLSEQCHVSPNRNPANVSAFQSPRPVPASVIGSCAQLPPTAHRSVLEPNAAFHSHPMPHDTEALAAFRVGYTETDLACLYNHISKRLMNSNWLADLVKAKVISCTKEISIVVDERLTQMGLSDERITDVYRVTEKLIGFEPDKFVMKNDPGYMSLLNASSEIHAVKGLRETQEASKVQQQWVRDQLASIEKRLGTMLSLSMIENHIADCLLKYSDPSSSAVLSVNEREEGEEDELEDEATLAAMRELEERRSKWLQVFKHLREVDGRRDEKVVRLQANLDQYAKSLISINEVIKQAVGINVD